MSSKEHMQLGWVVRWVLNTPPGHWPPHAAGRCGRVVPVLRTSLTPLYFVLALALRELASSRGVLPGAGALAGCRTPIQPVCSNSARAAKSRSRLCTVYCLVALCRLAQAAPVAKRSNGRYGWIPHNSSFGFLNLTPATLGQIHF
jgi:hypothetical protein